MQGASGSVAEQVEVRGGRSGLPAGHKRRCSMRPLRRKTCAVSVLSPYVYHYAVCLCTSFERRFHIPGTRRRIGYQVFIHTISHMVALCRLLFLPSRLSSLYCGVILLYEKEHLSGRLSTWLKKVHSVWYHMYVTGLVLNMYHKLYG